MKLTYVLQFACFNCQLEYDPLTVWLSWIKKIESAIHELRLMEYATSRILAYLYVDGAAYNNEPKQINIILAFLAVEDVNGRSIKIISTDKDLIAEWKSFDRDSEQFKSDCKTISYL